MKTKSKLFAVDLEISPLKSVPLTTFAGPIELSNRQSQNLLLKVVLATEPAWLTARLVQLPISKMQSKTILRLKTYLICTNALI